MFAPKVAKIQTTAVPRSTNSPKRQPSTVKPHRSSDGLVGSDQHEQQVERLAWKAPIASWDFSKIPLLPPERASRSQSWSPLPGVIQPKLAIGTVDDPLEREADSVAQKVMRGSGMVGSPGNAPAQISRRCAACEDEAEKLHPRLASASARAPATAPDIVHDVLRTPGQQLDPASRAFFEPRFGHDFSRVRVHDGDQADASARAVQARAFTRGRHIVFGRGEYAPSSEAGRELLAHELAHTIQQGSGTSEQPVRRRLTVDPAAVLPMPAGAAGPPAPLTISVNGLMNDMCPAGKPTVDHASGQASLGTAGFCDWAGPPTVSLADQSATPAGCNCLCSVINSTETTTVSFRAGGPDTTPGSVPAGVTPAPGQGGAATSPTVRIDPGFQGQYLIGGKWVDVPFHLLFAHELCGHALPKMSGTHVPRGPTPAGGTPPQEVEAVRVERAIAAEQGLPRRPDDYAGAARQRP